MRLHPLLFAGTALAMAIGSTACVTRTALQLDVSPVPGVTILATQDTTSYGVFSTSVWRYWRCVQQPEGNSLECFADCNAAWTDLVCPGFSVTNF